jgi:ATP-binding cassette subfamily C protein CydCD
MHRRLIALTNDTRLPLILTILAGFFVGLLTIWQAWLLSNIINAVFLEGASLEEVMHSLGWMLVAITGRGLLTWVHEVAANRLATRIKTDLRQRLFAHLLKLGPAYSRGQRTGELSTAAVEGIEALDAYFSQYLPQLAITALIPISILVVVFPIDLLSGVILLVTAPLIPFFMIMIGRGAEALTKRQFNTLSLLSAHFLDSLQGLTTLKLFGQSRAQARTIEQVSEKFRDATLGVLRVTFLSALVLELLATLSTAVIAVEIGFRLLYARMDFQPALFLLVLAPEFYMPLRALGARFHAGMAGTTAARRIYQILDTPATHPQPMEVREDISAVALSNVTFTYPGEQTPALKEIDLEIQAGQHIALVGKTGAGKTTLANLLLGFIQPTLGQVKTCYKTCVADGAPPMSRVAWVPQKPHLFHDTVAANICLGRQDAKPEEITGAAKAAHLHEFIDSLPQKYETIIGEGGARLSNGQAQRLALARAFLKNAPILILDEPTSSLDPETEALLEGSTRQLMHGRTVITIAHRLNTVFKADRILVLDTGQIVECGTHQELLAKNGMYAGMVKVHQPDRIRTSVEGQNSKVYTDLRPSAFNSVPSNFQSNRSSTFFRLLSFLQGNWGRVLLSILVGTGTILSSVALMGTSAWLISTAALHPSVADLGVSVVGVRLFGITRGLFRYFERLVSHDVAFRLMARLRTWFYEKLEPLAPARLMDFRSGDLLARIIGDIGTLEDFYVRVISPPWVALLVGVITSFFLASFDPLLGVVYLLLFLSSGFLLPALSHILSRGTSSQVVDLRAVLHTYLVDGVQGMADLLAYGQGGMRLDQIKKHGLEYGNAQRRLAFLNGLFAGLGTWLTNLGVWTILVLCIPQVVHGTLPGPMLASLTLLAFASFEAVTPLPLTAQLWNSSMQAARRLFEVVDTKPAVHEDAPHLPNDPTGTDMQFSDLSFTYPGQHYPAVQNISFKIKAGESIAIVGPSGAGKSTIANLLLRFWEYESGKICLGAESLRLYAQDQVRARIGYVSQNTYFFNTSIRENLRFARRRVSDEEIVAAARAAQIHDFIVELPKGYDTIIGEQGIRLSGGERQRLAIARALIKDAPILILDEPTANLDPLTERDVLQTLFRVMKGKTCLLITHRLIGLEGMHKILVMDRGQIVERGVHEKLLEKRGMYSHMLALQDRILNTEI